MKNFVTIDIEGDSLSRDMNQKLFPAPPHYDPETRIWCVSMYNGFRTVTYVCKLPSEPRCIRPGLFTKAYHALATKIPYDMDGHHITGFETYTGFLTNLYCMLNRAYQSGIKVFFRGYGKYDYDYDTLLRIFTRNDIPTDVLECMVNWNKVSRNYVWKNTAAQVKTGQWISNQQYMENGIRHNIEDVIQLYEIIDSTINDEE